MHFKTNRWIALAACLLCVTAAMAEEEKQEKWRPECGMELATELQGTGAGDFNLAALLRLHASLPIGHGFAVDLGGLSTGMTAAESIGVERQTCSNIDAGNVPFALSVAGVRWDFSTQKWGERHASQSLFVGIRNMNEDYFASPVTSFFTQSSCGIFPTLSFNYDMANYPNASIGAHYRVENSRGLVFQTSLYNGRGYRRFSGRENVFRFCPKDDGLFGLAEVAYNHKGSSYFAGTCVGLSPRPLPKRGSSCKRGVSSTPWLYAEQRLSDDITLLAGASHAFAEDAECTDFVGLGAHYALKRIELGVFTDYARLSVGNEWTTELTCKAQLTHHLFLQPALHFVVTPAASGTSSFQALGLLRLGIEI